MSEHDIIIQKLESLISEVRELKNQINPAQDTALIDLPEMAQRMAYSPIGFRNRMLPKMINAGVVKKYGGRYKARRCDFELYIMQHN